MQLIVIQIFDGENYSSIVPPRPEEPKKLRQETEEDELETEENLY